MSKLKEILKKTEENGYQTVKTWRAYCLNHYRYHTGSDIEKADDFYNAVKVISANNGGMIVNMSSEDLINLLVTGYYLQNEGTKRAQAKQALGLSDVFSIFGTYTKNIEGNRKFGECSIVLSGIKKALLFPGDPSRLRDPSRVDYAPVPSEVLFPLEKASDCRAIATILAMDASDLSGVETALLNVVDDSKDYGRCTAMIFDKISQNNISRIIVPTQEIADRVRVIMEGIGHLCRVEVSNNGVRTKDPFSFREGTDVKVTPTKEMEYFSVGDRICTKRTVTQAPMITGTIVDMTNGLVSIAWDHNERTVYDLSEALLYIMPAPSTQEAKYGDVVYSVPGLDSKSAALLNAFGVDPVTIYSLVSHISPASEHDEAWRDRLVSAMKTIGMSGRFLKGYLESDEGFEPREWFESRMPGGVRFIVDFEGGKFSILAGELDSYLIA